MKKLFRPGKFESLMFNGFNAVFMILLMVVTLYPFINTLAVSFNESQDTLRGGIYLLPRAFTLKNYVAIFSGGTLVNAFFISVARTVLSTILNIFLTAMLAYALSRTEYVFRKFITTVFVLTMYFHAGLIPVFFLMKGLGLINNFMVYIIPTLISAFNLIVIRTYIRTIPESMIESAKMDGAGEFRIFIQIIFPLCRPVLATIALFVAVGAWNTWFDTFLYCSSKQELSTLQYELMRILYTAYAQGGSAALGSGGLAADQAARMVSPMSIQAAITIIASVPILFVYPFLQKHFVVGLNVGSVKE
ncbi:MAG: carbohydrate ABC transporter permease [Spirochaetales bacterium]|nr:carbohydrate ABC transporter permease [Spirochaetales bacterium]